MADNSNRVVKHFEIDPETYKILVQFLGQFPYRQVNPLMQRLSQHVVPVYEQHEDDLQKPSEED